MVAGGGLALLVLLLGVGSHVAPSAMHEEFEVLHVASAPGGRSHAVVHRHRLPGTARWLTAVWLQDGAAPQVGSRLRPEGRLAAIWQGSKPLLTWKDSRLVVAGDSERVLREEPADGCYVDYRQAAGTPDWQLCFDPSRVTFVKLPR